MNLQTWNLGDIIRNHIYVREIYSTNQKDMCLFSSEDFLQKLGRIYDHLGIKRTDPQIINIKIKLPDNPNPVYRDYWNETTIIQSEERTSITKVNKFLNFFNKEVVFASSTWLGEFESFPGEKVIISPFPQLSSSSILNSLGIELAN